MVDVGLGEDAGQIRRELFAGVASACAMYSCER